jgi:hypothetical protein
MTAKSTQKLSPQNSTTLSTKSNSNTSRLSQLQQTKQFVAVWFVIQAIVIGVTGNIRVLSGNPLLDVIPSMIAQGVSLIVKAVKESDRK